MTERSASREAIAKRLRRAREQAGLSQGQVAKLLKYHRPSISEMEAGRRRIAAEEIQTFAELYGVDASWLLSEREENDPTTAKVRIAAREISKLKPKDLDRLLQILSAVRQAYQD